MEAPCAALCHCGQQRLHPALWRRHMWKWSRSFCRSFLSSFLSVSGAGSKPLSPRETAETHGSSPSLSRACSGSGKGRWPVWLKSWGTWILITAVTKLLHDPAQIVWIMPQCLHPWRPLRCFYCPCPGQLCKLRINSDTWWSILSHAFLFFSGQLQEKQVFLGLLSFVAPPHPCQSSLPCPPLVAQNASPSSSSCFQPQSGRCC